MITSRFRIILIVVLLFGFLGTSVTAQMAKSQESSTLEKRHSPRFEDFPVIEKFHSQPASVNLSSHPYARMFRTKLREGAKNGPNFAGHYALVWFGCGNECQQSLVVDLRTGKVYGLAEPLSKLPLQSSRGLDFKLESKLIIADPPCPKDYNPCVSWGRSGEPVRYYIIEDKGLRLIHTTPCKLVNYERQECGD